VISVVIQRIQCLSFQVSNFQQAIRVQQSTAYLTNEKVDRTQLSTQ